MAGNLTAMIAAIFSGEVTPDPYYEYTTLLLPGNGTNGAQNNTFLDGSTNNFTITRNGNTTQGTFSPFSQTGWGGYASATGQYLTAATSTAFDPGSSNFTVEAWIYPTALNTYNFIYTRDGATNAASQIAFGISSTGVLTGEVYVSSTAYTASSSAGAIVTNRWTHVAFVRNGTTTYLYVDGVQNGTNTGLSTSSINTVSIAANILNQAGAANRGMQGYCSNFRLAIGVAVYTGAFTPPTTPLAATQSSGTNISAITGTQTKILTFQSNRFIDNTVANSGAGWTLTVNGSPTVVAFSPFNPTASWSAATYGGSGYFDGSGDYLSVADSTAFDLNTLFTVELWFYQTASGNASFFNRGGGAGSWSTTNGHEYLLFIETGTLYWMWNNSGSPASVSIAAPSINTWNHFAIGYNGTTTRAWLNGVSIGTSASGYTLPSTRNVTRVGLGPSGVYPVNGYVSSLRVVKGTDVYGVSNTTITVPTAPLTAITNTSLLLNFTNAAIIDNTAKNVLETVGNAQISTSASKFGGGSFSTGATSGANCLTAAASPLLQMMTGNFTVEGWFLPDSGTTGTERTFYIQGVNTTGGLALFVGTGGARFRANGQTDLVYSGTISSSVFTHIAFVRNGNTRLIFVNGTYRDWETDRKSTRLNSSH